MNEIRTRSTSTAGAIDAPTPADELIGRLGDERPSVLPVSCHPDTHSFPTGGRVTRRGGRVVPPGTSRPPEPRPHPLAA